ncbi:MAG: transposase, partial [Kiritimatiellae bacterium]|nr:transposase [Kiritimatiellia bacterium]
GGGMRIDIYVEYAEKSAIRPECGELTGAQKILRLSWHQTQSIMALAVRRGMARRNAVEIPFVGMDEKSFRRGKRADDFACVTTDIEGRRVLDAMRAALQTGRAWGFKEMFGSFWRSAGKRFAEANFTFWYEQVAKSCIKPMIKAANTLKRHLYGLLSWFDSMIDNALAEGFNSTIQSLKASARGRNFENFCTAILFFCGKLDLRPDFVRIGSTL